MIKKITALSLVSLALMSAGHADEANSCYVEVAVSSPPVERSASVAFNVNNDRGDSGSIVLEAGSHPKKITKLPCTDSLYTISATEFYTDQGNISTASPTIGQCYLKAGGVALTRPGNSVAVVYPFDFQCSPE